MVKTLATYWNFLCAGLANPEHTGAVVPSQRFLISKMIAPVPESYSGEVVELGPGNGALTVRLARRCPAARILACEINPALARDCQAKLASAGLDNRVKVICDSAEHLLTDMAASRKPAPDFVISGIPLANVSRECTRSLVGKIHRCLAKGGMYIQFQHSLLDRKTILARFPRLRTSPAFLNFPPAFVYYARKDRA
jgi:phospholipid N-methyltransferase